MKKRKLIFLAWLKKNTEIKEMRKYKEWENEIFNVNSGKEKDELYKIADKFVKTNKWTLIAWSECRK